MNKVKLIMLLLFLSPLQVPAQVKLAFGVSAGMGMSRLYNALPPSGGGYQYRLSPVAGLQLKYHVVDQLDAVAECNYLQIRTMRLAFGTGEGGPPTDLMIRLDYLELPLMIRRYFGDPGQPLRPYICFGPYFSRLLLSDQSHIDSSLQLHLTDIGSSQGAGLLIQFKQVQLSVEARYNMGLRNIRRGATGNLKTDLLSIRTGVCFIFP